jgi:hypothetical protein
MKALGFSNSIAWVVGVSRRDETTGILKPSRSVPRPTEDLRVGAKTRPRGLATHAGPVQVLSIAVPKQAQVGDPVVGPLVPEGPNTS